MRDINEWVTLQYKTLLRYSVGDKPNTERGVDRPSKR